MTDLSHTKHLRVKTHLLILFCLCCSCTSMLAQDTDQLVAELHNCLQSGQLDKGVSVYEVLNRETPAYIGFFSSTFELYMAVCTDNLDLIIGQDEIERFYQMCMMRSDKTARTKGKILSDIASTLCQYEQYQIGLYYYEQLIPLEKELDPLSFHRNLMSMGWAYNYSQQPQKAYLAFKRCADFYKKTYGMNSRNYAKSLEAMAFVSRYINADYYALLQEQMTIYKNLGDTLSEAYAITLDNINAYHQGKGCNDIALDYAIRANRIFETSNRKSDHYAISLNNVGTIYQKMGKTEPSYYSLAEQYFLESIRITPENQSVLNLALLYEDQGKADEAMEYYDLVDEDMKHGAYADVLADHYAKVGDYGLYTLYMEDYLNYIRTIHQQNVPYMTEAERSRYIDLIQNEHLELLFDLASENRNDRLPGLCFNYLLMSRSLLLSYIDSIQSIVRHSSNQRLKDIYTTLAVLRHNAAKDDSARQKADSLERSFLELLSREDNFSGFTSIEYGQIRQCLGEEDAVIEFFENPSYTHPKLYAVLLSADQDPTVVTCFDTDEEHRLVDQHQLTEAIWDRISTYVGNKSNIYFTPSGSLHTYPFESESSLSYPEKSVFRLSSSRELIKQKNPVGKGAAVYGGLDYDMSVSQMEEDFQKYPKRRTGDLADELTLRYAVEGIPPLPATAVEAETVSDVLVMNDQGSEVSTYLGQKGTETSFKWLSGKRKRIIHIATHGFYEEDLSKSASLSHSGLLFAGASNIMERGLVPSSIDDGILTAQEVSELNLAGLELVCLSACQTALGEITNDGVFGLQRGFKRAGASSILMSLWKVDDDATCLLMTTFYKSWIQDGKTKHQALEIAKKEVRSHKEKGWDNPTYWAAFILIDSLD